MLMMSHSSTRIGTGQRIPYGWERRNPGEPILYPPLFPPEHFLVGPSYKPQAGDVIISAYPKAGCLWTQDIVYQLMHEGEPVKDINDIDYNFPWLDSHNADEILSKPHPRFIKTHFSPGGKYLSLPFNDDTNYIYVVRNPLDTVISFYHHVNNRHCYFASISDADYTPRDFFELFMAGEVLFGDYFEHIKRWLPFLDRPNVHLIKFEQLKRNGSEEIRKLATFLVGRNVIKNWFTSEDLKKIEIASNFANMNKRNAPQDRWRNCTGHLRKGKVGGWRAELSQDEATLVVQKFRHELQGTAAENWWPEMLDNKN